MTYKERERVKALRRRMAYLDKRIAEKREHDGSWDKQELSALTWAVEFIEGALDAQEDAKGEAFFNDTN